MEGDQQRLLATMPLHAITSTYGEPGLRDRFAVEIASWAEADRRRLERALDLASRLHAGDRRDTEPYVNHLLRVAIRIMSHYGVHDTDVVCAALLHDAVEDHPADLAACGGGADLAACGGGADLAACGGGADLAACGGGADLAACGGGADLAACGGGADLAACGGGADLAACGGEADLAACGGGAELTDGPADQQAALAVLAAEFGPRVAE